MLIINPKNREQQLKRVCHVLEHQLDLIQQLKGKAVNTSQTTRAFNLNAIILFYKCREKLRD